MGRIKLWVDDLRAAPPGFNAHARTYAEAIRYLKSGRVVVISLDHDLGDEKSGYDVAKWIEEKASYGQIPPIAWTVHSANPPGASRIVQALKKAERFWSQRKWTGGSHPLDEEASAVGEDGDDI